MKTQPRVPLESKSLMATKPSSTVFGILVFFQLVAGAACGPATSVAPGLPDSRPAAASPSSNSSALTVIGWNVESGGIRLQTVTGRIRKIQGCDLWGLSEVRDDRDAKAFETAAEDGENADFERILGSTGDEDRLAIIYNTKKLEKLDIGELHDINPNGAVRSPLHATFRIKGTGVEFVFMVNHLYRGNDEARHRQAADLNRWAKRQRLPVVAVGDYNFDWNVQNGETDHDEGYDELTAGSVFRWVRPRKLVRTQFSENSVLDFVFVSKAAQNWKAESRVIVEPGDETDRSDSDHRMVEAVFAVSN